MLKLTNERKKSPLTPTKRLNKCHQRWLRIFSQLFDGNELFRRNGPGAQRSMLSARAQHRAIHFLKFHVSSEEQRKDKLRKMSKAFINQFLNVK